MILEGLFIRLDGGIGIGAVLARARMALPFRQLPFGLEPGDR